MSTYHHALALAHANTGWRGIEVVQRRRRIGWIGRQMFQVAEDVGSDVEDVPAQGTECSGDFD